MHAAFLGKARTKKLLAALLALAAIGLAVLMVLWVTSKSSLDKDARRTLEAALANDPDTVYDFSHDFQKESIGMTRDKFRAMWRALIAPRLEGLEIVRPIEAYVERGDHQGLAWAVVRTPSGTEFEVSTSPFETGEGGKSGLMEWLVTAWIISYCYMDDGPRDAKAIMQARIRGIESDMLTLQTLGITSFPATFPGDRPLSLDEVREKYYQALRKLESADSTAVDADG